MHIVQEFEGQRVQLGILNQSIEGGSLDGQG
jgi:hypothetical protein